jgi:sulfur-oxidizing protein SoxB
VGSHGKFVSRVDLDVKDGKRCRGYSTNLIPVFSDVIAPDPEMAAMVDETRAPYRRRDAARDRHGRIAPLPARQFQRDLGRPHLRGHLISQRDTQIALSPGFRWGAALLPGQEITREDIYNVTAMTYPNAYRTEMTGEMLHTIFEDVAANLFSPDAYFQQGGDMVRIGGLGYRIDINQEQGSRITDMTLLSTGEPIDPAQNYVVAGWASVNEGTEGPPIWEVLEAHIREQGTVTLEPNNTVDVVGG